MYLAERLAESLAEYLAENVWGEKASQPSLVCNLTTHFRVVRSLTYFGVLGRYACNVMLLATLRWKREDPSIGGEILLSELCETTFGVFM